MAPKNSGQAGEQRTECVVRVPRCLGPVRLWLAVVACIDVYISAIGGRVLRI